MRAPHTPLFRLLGAILDFYPAEATRCTDGGEFGAENSTKFQPPFLQGAWVPKTENCAEFRNTDAPQGRISCATFPWLGPLTTVEYVMYFRFCG